MISSPLLLETHARSLSLSPSNSLAAIISPQTTAQSGLSTTTTNASTSSSEDFDIAPYCIGTPHHIGTSSSGTITLKLSLQENVIYLPCPEATGPSSYREHDSGINADPFVSNTPPVNDPLNENYSPSPSFTESRDLIPELSSSNAAAAPTPPPSTDPQTANNRHSHHEGRDAQPRSSRSRGRWLGRRRDDNDDSASTGNTNRSSSHSSSPSDHQHHRRGSSPEHLRPTRSTNSTSQSANPSHRHRREHIPKHITNLVNSSLSPDSTTSDAPPAILRGSLVMKLAKPTKIKGISLRFYGKSKSNWLESNYSKDLGITLPHGPEFQDEVLVNSHTWDFVPSPPDAPTPSSIVNLDGVSVVSSDLLGADVVYVRPPGPGTAPEKALLSPGLKFKTPLPPEPAPSSTDDSGDPDDSDFDDDSDTRSSQRRRHHHHHHHHHHHGHHHGHHRRASEPQALSLNHVPFFTPLYFKPDANGTSTAADQASTDTPQGLLSPSFNPIHGNSSTLYPAGDYVFHFTLAIDARTAETIRCPNGTVRYYIVARINRSSRFSFATTGHREITLVRSPPNMYDTTIDSPIAISRDWDNRLHYEIMCPKKYIPLGTSIPLSIKLTPIDKVQVHRVRVQVIETVNYICAKTDALQHIDPLRKVTLFQQRAPSLEDAAENTQGHPDAAAASTSTAPDKHGHSNNKTKKKSGLTPGNLLSYLKSPTATTSSKHAPAASSVPSSSLISTTHSDELNADLGELLSTTTEIECSLPFVSREENWDSVASHHFIAPPTDSRYFQFLRPDALYNPYIHVRHRLHVSFRLSKKEANDAKRRYFEVLIDTPIHFMSKHCKTESTELPLYEEGSSNGGSETLQQRQFMYHQQLLLQYQNELQLFNHNNNSTTEEGDADSNAVPNIYDFGSPLVRAVSSGTSSSPTLEGFGYLQGHTPPVLPPSFDDALSDPLLSAPGSPLTPAQQQQSINILGSPTDSNNSDSDDGTVRSMRLSAMNETASLASFGSSIAPTASPSTAPGAAALSLESSAAPPNYADSMRETVPLLRQNSDSSRISHTSQLSGVSSMSLGSMTNTTANTSSPPSIMSSFSGSTAGAGVGIGLRSPAPSTVPISTPVYVHSNLSTNGSRLQVHSNYFGRGGIGNLGSTGAGRTYSQGSDSPSTTSIYASDENYTDGARDDNQSELQLYMESMQSSRYNSPGF